jgi:hypothetical protein
MQRGRFAASAGTQQNAKFPIFDIEVKAGHRLYLSKIFAHIFQHNFRQLIPSLIAIKQIQQGASAWPLASCCWLLVSGSASSKKPVAGSLK